MRLVVFGILFLLFFGCVSPEETTGEIERNVTEEYGMPVENITGTEEENESIYETDVENKTIEQEIIEEPEESEPVEEAEEENRILFGGRYALVVDDVVWYGDKSCAAISIEYAEGGVLKKDVVCPRVDYYWTSPDGNRYRIFVSEVAAGYSGEKWADIIVYG
jgi:hypothetical protein